MRKVQHSLLRNAKLNKKDEFYTQFKDIESELKHYKHHFKGKTVFCNCDEPNVSNFFNYFIQNFKELGLKKLISACYKKEQTFPENMPLDEKNGYYCEVSESNLDDNIDNLKIYFQGDGDFRSEESIALLKKSDIIVTNPPFSLFREFVAQLIAHKKNFLIIGNINAITYKEIFKLIKENKVWLGVNLGRGISGFIVPKKYDLYGTEVRIDEFGNKIVSPNNCLWLTNLDNAHRHEDIELTKIYKGNESYYPTYDNFDGINVNKTKEIPKDYNGFIGVPITFLHKYNPEQFEIVRFRKGNDDKDLSVNGKCTYFRILIINKRLKQSDDIIENLPDVSL